MKMKWKLYTPPDWHVSDAFHMFRVKTPSILQIYYYNRPCNNNRTRFAVLGSRVAHAASSYYVLKKKKHHLNSKSFVPKHPAMGAALKRLK